VLLSSLLRQEQGLNHTKNQEIKGHLNSWSNIEVRKIDQNVAQRSECSSWDQKLHFRSFASEAPLQEHASEASLQKHYFRSTFQKLHFSYWLLFQYKVHVTWICVQESTFAWINQAIKAYTRIMSKGIFNVHLRLWTLMY